MHAVIFDIDGTLLQSASVDDELYRLAVQTVVGPVKFRRSLSDYDYVTDSGILYQVLEDNALPTGPDLTTPIKAHFVDLLHQHVRDYGPFREIPGARDFLRTLCNSSDCAVAIATGGWRESAQLKLDAAQFVLDGVPIATSDTEYDRSRIMLTALSGLGSDFESITYYGDGPWDRDACLVLDWTFIPVGPGLAGLESYSGERID
jgi:phosphoglycolate phosphatase-like HAD superfamily hydrolase